LLGKIHEVIAASSVDGGVIAKYRLIRSTVDYG
jgi:hypothetical protein